MKVNSIKKLVEIALDKKANINAEYILGKFPSNQSRFVEKITGHKFIGVERIIESRGIRHALAKHGDQQVEAKHGQVAVTIDDFNKIPLILKEPDVINYSRKNHQQEDVFIYQKKIGVIYFVVEAISLKKGNHKIVFKTMYKRNKKPLK